MKKLIIAAIVLLFCLEIKADIAPDPIRARGININGSTEIKMTYEKVVVDLTLDSSSVYCYFRLHNEGKAQKIQIGYPNMGYYFNNDLRNFKVNPINVYENGKKTDVIHFNAPDSINLPTNDNIKKSWYLWNTSFDENETRIIVVSYSLPYGTVKNNLYYTFDYLLSTGAGWKGKIDTAEIIVNLMNFDKDLILKTSPANFVIIDNQIVWKLYDLEPTVKDNISIKYEMRKGQYGEQLKKFPLPVWILNDQDILSNDIRDGNKFENITPHEIALIKTINDSVMAKKKFPKINFPGGLILVYTKKFAIDKFSEIVNSRLPRKYHPVKFTSTSDFEDNYSLKINERVIEKGVKLYEEIFKIDNLKINKISIKDLDNNKHEISIN